MIRIVFLIALPLTVIAYIVIRAIDKNNFSSNSMPLFNQISSVYKLISGLIFFLISVIVAYAVFHG